jgi:hypothetical protein
MTGYGDQYDSTRTNRTPITALATNKPHMSGCDHGSSSVDLRLKPSRTLPTVPTSVTEPAKSILDSFSYVERFCTSSGNLILTFHTTKNAEKARIGICIERVIEWDEERQVTMRGNTCTRKAERLNGNINEKIGEYALNPAHHPKASLSHPPSGPPMPAPTSVVQ